MEIELVRGTRRRKHIEAALVGDRLRVSFPSWMSLADAQEAAEELAERMRRRIDPARIDVATRARRLARARPAPAQEGAVVGPSAPALGLVHSRGRDDPRVVAARRLPALGARLRARPRAGAPARRAPRSGARRLVNRFPLAERARGFLVAKDLDPDDPDDCDEPPLLSGDVRP